MSLIRFENVSKSFAGQSVLEGIHFRVEEGEKIGLIGRNGTGKTTLFRLITGEVEPEGGVIERRRRARVAYLVQLPRFDEGTSVLDVAMTPFQDLVQLEEELRDLETRMAGGDESVVAQYGRLQDTFALRGGYDYRTEAKRVLQGLEFGSADFERPVCVLSGGQTTRLLLALVLLQEADLLLLDEPENHLDISAREWVEEYLKGCSKAVVIISHYRSILNAVADRIVEIDGAELHEHRGNYDAYLEHKALRREQQQKDYARQQEFIRKEQHWIERFRYKNTKARQVQSRIKRLEKMERLDAPECGQATAGFRFGEVVRTGEVVLDAEDLSMAYGANRLYSGLSFKVHRHERIGIVGPNGSGKTTLLRHLAGRLPEGAGRVTLGHKAALGFYEQKHESLNPANDILTEVHAVRPDWNPEQVRTFLGRLLFTGDDVFKPIATLSGGELSRVAVAKLILGEANVLLLDEPTNHLDIASRESLEEALAGFPGALLICTHDRTLIDRMADRLLVIEGGHAHMHLGNYADYHRAVLEETVRREVAEAEMISERSSKKPRKADRHAENERRRHKQRMEKIEADIEDTEEAITRIEIRFTEIDPTDYQQARNLQVEYESLKKARDALYAQWEHLAE